MKQAICSGVLIETKEVEYARGDYDRYWRLKTSVNSGGVLPHGLSLALERIGKENIFSAHSIPKLRQRGIIASEMTSDPWERADTDVTSLACFYDPACDALSYPDISSRLGFSIRSLKTWKKEGLPIEEVNGHAVCCINSCTNWLRIHGKLK